jgi:hypothetical protein
MKVYWQEPAVRLSSFLVVLGIFAAAASIPLHSQSPTLPVQNAQTLIGTVVDQNQTPLAGAELTISREGRTLAVLRTAENGAFTFYDPARGTIQLLARRLGYRAESVVIDLNRKPRTEVMIVLEMVPNEVEPVMVSGRGGRLALFNEHRKHNTFGQFMDREEIEKKNVRLASDLLRSVAGASLRASRRYGNTIRLRGCQPIVWIDRVPIRDVELDEVAVPEEIAGLEIYSSATTVPPEYMDRGGRSCGAIVVWTRIN